MWTITSKVPMLTSNTRGCLGCSAVGPSTTVMAIEGRPDLTTVDGRQTVG